jgi:hypothetical protein
MFGGIKCKNDKIIFFIYIINMDGVNRKSKEVINHGVTVESRYFYLSHLDMNIELKNTASTSDDSVLHTNEYQAEAVLDIKNDTINKMFTYIINNIDGTDHSQDITYGISANNNEIIISNSIVRTNPMLTSFNGVTLTDIEQYIAKDFLRFIGEFVFGSSEITMFVNEDVVINNINELIDSNFSNNIISASQINDDNANKANICRDLYIYLRKRHPDRFFNLDKKTREIQTKGGVINYLPFMIDDIICFKITINLHKDQLSVLQKNIIDSAVRKRTYLIKIKVVADEFKNKDETLNENDIENGKIKSEIIEWINNKIDNEKKTELNDDEYNYVKNMIKKLDNNEEYKNINHIDLNNIILTKEILNINYNLIITDKSVSELKNSKSNETTEEAKKLNDEIDKKLVVLIKKTSELKESSYNAIILYKDGQSKTD